MGADDESFRMHTDGIAPAESPVEYAEATTLVLEYVGELEDDLAFRHANEELGDLQEEYVAPDGRLLIAWMDGAAVGCAGVRRATTDICELTRHYVRSSARGKGVGRRLVEAAMAEARKLGFRRMRLDVLPTMRPAIAVYRALGFRDAPAHRDYGKASVLFLEADLGKRL
ncbi:MAG TPA: GNAT family N-acetyltransferase [Candidatus Thermoplasmatota archaeon]|nr:GNAT family N-acetyltransferase [Candidatus Thermoplasmatota archaeon]